MSQSLMRRSDWDVCVDARMIWASDDWNDAREFKSHAHVMRRLFDDLGVLAIVCVDGRPTACLLDGRKLANEDIQRTRRSLWNLGATTLLIVERLNKIEMYSTLATPVKDEDNTGFISKETIDFLELGVITAQIQRFVRRLETGAIYRDHEYLFNPRAAVDRFLLENLKVASDLLCPDKTGDGYRRAHALIGRFLFSCYLLDRGIIGPGYLQRCKLPLVSDMLDFLGIPNAADCLNSLFAVLQRDFNGSLFGNQLDAPIVDGEVRVLRRLLAGDNLRSGHQSLFKLYDFSFIPVELISSIYQEFLGAEANADAEDKLIPINAAKKKGRQRASGAYYTPPRVAELAIDIATDGWDTLLDKQCLDPACGSGIFLVILFVRMAEEWRKRNPNASTRLRYDQLLHVLSNNLRGIDIHLTACLVTCFSLYLAFLDQMEPKEIDELREVLERDIRAKLLPRILWEKGRPRPRSPHIDSIRELDFFELEVGAEFDLVVGNPPWVSRKPAPSATNWIFADGNIDINVKNAEKQQTLFPTKELACAFMWKGPKHVRPNGRVCQILPSRVFLSNNTDRFQIAWINQHRFESVWLLADYSFILFPNADCPCVIARYRPRQKDEPFGRFEFVTPKVELSDPRDGTIPVQSEDQKTLEEADIVAAANRNEAAMQWKQFHWGTPRDRRLLSRLLTFPRLSSLAKRPPKNPAKIPSVRRRVWYKGQGIRPVSESTEESDPIFWTPETPFVSAHDNHELFVLHPKPIGDRFAAGLDRSRNPLIFRGPMVLINKACTKFLFSDVEFLLFQDDFQSICGPPEEEDELLFLTAFLSSPLAQYIIFHVSANIGIERDIVRLEEILELPFPLPENMKAPDRSRTIIAECAAELRALRTRLLDEDQPMGHGDEIKRTKKKLRTLVYEYFDICAWEQQLVEDTVKVFRPSSTPGSLLAEKLYTAKPSKPSHRKAYASTLAATFSGWTRKKSNLAVTGRIATELGLAMLSFTVGTERPYEEKNAEMEVEEVLKRIRDSNDDSTVSYQLLKGFIFYDGPKAYLIKPLSQRNWTRTAALNDADEILSQMMMEDGWH